MRLCLSASGEMLSMVLLDVAELCAATICIVRTDQVAATAVIPGKGN